MFDGDKKHLNIGISILLSHGSQMSVYIKITREAWKNFKFLCQILIMTEVGPSNLNNDCTNHVILMKWSLDSIRGIQSSRNGPQLYNHLPTTDKYPYI